MAKLWRSALQGADNVEVRETSIVDRAAYAVKDIPIGSVVFAEKPLILFPKLRKDSPVFDQMDQLTEQHNFPVTSLYPIYYYTVANEDIQSRIMSFFWPNLKEGNQAERESYERYKNIAHDAAKIPEFSKYDPELFIKILLICRTNQHGTGDCHHTSALYELGSKVTHSCDPNCMALMESMYVLTYKATKNIKAGDMITFSYIEGFELWKPTEWRRKTLLVQRYFNCCCERCTGPDYARRLLCPHCNDNQTLYHMPGQLSFHGRIGKPTTTPWRCPNCGSQLSDSEMNLEVETALLNRIITTFFEGHKQQDRDEAVELLRQSKEMLGEYHCGTALMVYTMIALHHSALQHKHREPEDPEHIMLWCQHLSYWFSVTLPNSMPEAIINKFCGQTAEMHNNYSQAAVYYAKGLPALRVHYGVDHPAIHREEEFVFEWGTDALRDLSLMNLEEVAARRNANIRSLYGYEIPTKESEKAKAQTSNNKSNKSKGKGGRHHHNHHKKKKK